MNIIQKLKDFFIFLYLPVKEELLKTQTDDLVVIGICQLPYWVLVVLFLKPNCSVLQRVAHKLKLCTRYIFPSTYGWPAAWGQTFDLISTFDLKSGYHQLNVYGDDRNETALICPLKTYRCKWIPFRLRNSPATTLQQRLDNFCKGLPYVINLT